MINNRFEIRVRSLLGNLDAVLHFVETCANGHLGDDVLKKLLVSVEEIFVNICHYAYPGAVGSVTVQIVAKPEFAVVVKDCGQPFNPLAKSGPNLNQPAAERTSGGLGIFMVKQYMRRVAYSNENGCNVLTLVP